MSHYTRKAVLEVAPGSDTRVITVHGVNGDVFEQTPLNADLRARYKPNCERVLLTVTRLDPYKGVDRLLESLPAICVPSPGSDTWSSASARTCRACRT